MQLCLKSLVISAGRDKMKFKKKYTGAYSSTGRIGWAHVLVVGWRRFKAVQTYHGNSRCQHGTTLLLGEIP